jgi:hypothetical protein
MIEIIFVWLATHLQFHVGTLDYQIQIWQFKSQNDHDLSICKNLNLESESTDNSLRNDYSLFHLSVQYTYRIA